jgi:spore coat polysaccharide biosynthesis predicted glycosyltransferase SpsG
MIAVSHILEKDFSSIFLIRKENEPFCLPLLIGREIRFLKEDDDLINFVSKNDLLWVDGYSFDAEWRMKFKAYVSKLIYINDLPENVMGADVVVNHCPGIETGNYPSPNKSDTQFLLGLDYALLRPAFLNYARSFKEKTNTVGVFICFGGADPKRLGEQFVSVLLDAGFTDPIYFVPSNASVSINSPNVIILNNLSENEMIVNLERSKVVVVPSSMLSIEAMAIRKPIFTMYYVDNQELIYHGNLKLQLAAGCGFIESGDQIQQTINTFLNFYEDNEQQLKLIENQKRFLDGFSDKRILEKVKAWVSSEKN